MEVGLLRILGHGRSEWLFCSWMGLAVCMTATELAAQVSEGHSTTSGDGLHSLRAELRPFSGGRRDGERHHLKPDTSCILSAMMRGEFSDRGVVPGVRLERVAGATLALVAANVAAYAHFHEVWWDHPRTRFHLYRGWRRSSGAYDLGPDDSLWHHVDKCGHFFSASQLSRHGAATARWVGLSAAQADWAGFLLASFLMLEIEVYDGFFAEWGFSLGDFLANEVGAAFPVLQRRHPAWRKLAIKLSYCPSGDPVYGRYLVEDYAGMTFWLCLDEDLFLPHKARRFWPDILDVAIGYGVTAKTGGAPELYVALDIDLRQVRVSNGVLRPLVAALEAVHLPAPALRLTPSRVAYFLYF